MATARQEEKIPALHPGDHLSIEEFERRYEAMPDVKKAELIEGVVYMPSPVSLEDHGNPHLRFSTWLGLYEAFTPGTVGGDNATLRLGVGASEPQPDLCLLVGSKQGGQARVVDGYIVGAPELVAEVAASSVSYDLHVKLQMYQRNGVREYLVWRVGDAAIDWFMLEEGTYRRVATDDDGVLRSHVFPGLWLDAAALIGGDQARVITVLQVGLASEAHAQFVRTMSANQR